MRHVRVPLLLLSLLVALPCAARAEGRAGSIDVWVYESFASQSFKDWNDRNDIFNTGVEFFGVGGGVHGFGRAIPYGAELAYRVTQNVSFGVAVGRQKGLANNRVNDTRGFIVTGTPGTYRERIDLKLNKIVGTVGAKIPGSPGIFVWGELGFGFAEAEIHTSFVPTADPSSNFTSEGRWTGSAMMGGLHLGIRREIGGRSMLRGTVGFQSANMGKLDGPGGPPVGLSPTGGPGEPMDTDFTGFHISGAIGLILKGAK
jgi:hypothetical protein